MTSDELKNYVEALVVQKNYHPAIYAIFSLVFGAIGSVVMTFLNERAKNAATKADIGEITKEVKKVEAGFDEKLARLQATLSFQGEYGKIRYEREMKIYEGLWPILEDVRDNLAEISRLNGHVPKQDTAQGNPILGFQKAFQDLQQQVRSCRPFYPSSIWESLQKLLELCATECNSVHASPSGRNSNDILLSWRNINEQVDLTCEAIRSRLTRFDLN
jgi:hypothetical protein